MESLGSDVSLDRAEAGARELTAFSYISRAEGDWIGTDALLDLIARSAERNRALGVTGVLVLRAGRFRQWLEGPRPALARLRAAIMADQRHRVVTATTLAPVPARLFDGWGLHLLGGPEDLPSGRLSRLAGVTPVPGPLLDEAPDGGKVLSDRAAFCADTRLCPRRDGCMARDPQDGPWTCGLAAEAAEGDGRALNPWRLASTAVRGQPPEDLLAPAAGDLRRLARAAQAAMDDLGAAWGDDRLTAAEIAVALMHLHGVLRPFCDRPEPLAPRGHVLLATPADSNALVGPMLKAALLREAGWRVSLRRRVGLPDLLDLWRRLRPDAVILAGTRPFPTAGERAMAAAARDAVRAVAAELGDAPLLLAGTLGATPSAIDALPQAVAQALSVAAAQAHPCASAQATGPHVLIPLVVPRLAHRFR